MRRILAVAVVSCFACAPVEPESQQQLARSESELRGGTPDTTNALPSVYFMRMVFNTGQAFGCTATLITSRTLLAAAHCFDPTAGPPGLTSLTDVYVQNASPAPSSMSPTWIRIDPMNTRMHPMWSSSDRLSYDIGAALLPMPSTVTPTPHVSRTLTNADVGRMMTVAGFGITAPGNTDFGTRRVATLPLRGLTGRHIQLGDMSNTGICNGDSGGPSFLTERDGIKRVAGVHSYDSSLNCLDGLDTRVDLFSVAFVQDFIRDFEGGPTCFEDGMCAMGCATPDVDCVCTADGTCNGMCPNLLTDPDCPADCVANSVCATQNCPRLDPDCTAELDACGADAQCQYRVCATDPQRPQRYCSRPCTATCMSGTECVNGTCLQPQLPNANPGDACTAGGTFCLQNTRCTGFPGEALTCRTSCNVDTDCGTPGDCIAAENGAQLCRPTAPLGASCNALTLCLGMNAGCTGYIGLPLTCRATCSSSTQCPGSECVAGQNGFQLCLPTAQAGEDCELSLTRCQGMTSCTGLPGETARCIPTCVRNSDCATGESCVPGQANLKVCAKDPINLVLIGDAESKVIGCSSSGASALMMLALLLVRRFAKRTPSPSRGLG